MVGGRGSEKGRTSPSCSPGPRGQSHQDRNCYKASRGNWALFEIRCRSRATCGGGGGGACFQGLSPEPPPAPRTTAITALDTKPSRCPQPEGARERRRWPSSTRPPDSRPAGQRRWALRNKARSPSPPPAAATTTRSLGLPCHGPELRWRRPPGPQPSRPTSPPHQLLQEPPTATAFAAESPRRGFPPWPHFRSGPERRAGDEVGGAVCAGGGPSPSGASARGRAYFRPK